MAPFNTTSITDFIYLSANSRHLATVQASVLSLAVILASISINYAARQIFRPSKPSILTYAGVIAGALLYCYVADRTPVFQHIPKTQDERAFLALCLLSLLVGIGNTRHHNACLPPAASQGFISAFGTLSRQQTEEWKGWMQIVILLYHYFGMSQVLHVYRVIRLLVGSYLFLTGYGHTLYFLRTNDFSLRRVASVSLRINLLVCLLPFVMDTKYELYYFPALSTFWFLITWATIPKRSKGSHSLRNLCLRLLGSCLLTEVLLSAPSLWYAGSACLRHAGMFDFDAHEFVFRIALDRYIPYIGMLLACIQEQYTRTLENLDGNFPARPWLSTRKTVAAALLILSAYFFFSSQLADKHASNRYHPFTEAVPILAYIVIRNASSSLQNHYSRVFAWFGRYSLETFILQYHIWLAADTKQILHFGFRIPLPVNIGHDIDWIELFLTTATFLSISFGVGNAASAITAWVIGPKALQNEPEPMSDDSPEWRPPVSIHGLVSTICRGSLTQRLVFMVAVLWLLNVLW